mmetsp:Transcript_26324/g.72356  ORF Transcript_26324/g.72356 Transcript_26324/m.72356 type:complete len:225 (-) Transcript_26324:666-1340(-)
MLGIDGLCPLPLCRAMEMPLPPPEGTPGSQLRDVRKTVRPPPAVGPARGQRGLVGSDAPPRDRGAETAAHLVAARSRHCAEAVAAPDCPGAHVPDCRLVLSGPPIAQEEGSREATVGLQPLSAQGAMEVRPVPPELLLFPAVPERFVAHCAQARVLQGQSMVLVHDCLRNRDPAGLSRHCARSARVRCRIFVHPPVLLRPGNSRGRNRNRAQEELWIGPQGQNF